MSVAESLFQFAQKRIVDAKREHRQAEIEWQSATRAYYGNGYRPEDETALPKAKANCLWAEAAVRALESIIETKPKQ